MQSYYFHKMCCIAILSWTALGGQVFARDMAISFDDGLNPQLNPKAIEINQHILQHLQQHQIHAIIFPALSKIGDYQGLQLVKAWAKQGHRIGNHSVQHLNLNKAEITLSSYVQDIEQAHHVFSHLDGWTARYRYPYLKEGNSVEKRDGLRQWLQKNHYQSGAVTIDASDWFYNQLYLKYSAQQDQVNLERLRQAYITHLTGRANYYDQLAKQVIGYSPKHVLLLHVNAINAAWLSDIVQAFRQQSWQFIDIDTAYTDPVYQHHVDILPAGESLIWSIAKVKGHQGLRYPAEDAPYEIEHLKQHGLMRLMD